MPGPTLFSSTATPEPEETKPVALELSYEKQKENLKKYPGTVLGDPASTHPDTLFVVPDLHGNALKLIWYLVAYSMLKMDTEKYEIFRDIYIQLERETDRDKINKLLCIWSDCLAACTFHPAAGILLLAGDEFGDRGTNDWLTLKVIEAMHDAGMRFISLFSNHAYEFIAHIEGISREIKETKEDIKKRKEKVTDEKIIGIVIKSRDFHETQFIKKGSRMNTSLIKLGEYLEQGIIQWSSTTPRGLLEIYSECYLPHLRLLACATGFSESDYSCVLFTHAPAGTKTVRQLMQFFSPGSTGKEDKPFETPAALEAEIDHINAVFTGWAKAFIISSMLQDEDGAPLEEAFTKPLYKIMWNREYTGLEVPGQKKKMLILEIHGHDKHDPRADPDADPGYSDREAMPAYIMDDKNGGGPAESWPKKGGRTPLCCMRAPSLAKQFTATTEADSKKSMKAGEPIPMLEEEEKTEPRRTV